MDIVADSYFCIGKTHLVCQDYACHRIGASPYVIIADGCSSSADTDVGARLLALIAKRYLEQQLASTDLVTHFITSGHQCIENLDITAETLDATLIIAHQDSRHIGVRVYGDACVLAQKHDGQQQCFQIEYAHNAPYYLSYRLDAKRRQHYLNALGGTAATAQKITCFNNTNAYVLYYPYDLAMTFHFDLETYDRVVIATDGLASLTDTATGAPIALTEVGKACLALKNLNGEFIKRRLRRLLADFAKRNIHPLDDIAVAALAWGSR